MNSKEIKNKGERQYAELLEKYNIDYVYQPKSLSILFDRRQKNARPDFYIPLFNIYVEVIAGMAAFYARKEIIRQIFKEGYNLIVVNPDGSLFKNGNELKNEKRQYMGWIMKSKIINEPIRYLHKNSVELKAIRPDFYT